MDEDPYRDIAQWLQDVARRKAPGGAARVSDLDSPPVQAAARADWGLFRQSLWLAVLTGSYLQYHFMDVMLQIATMKSVVVFV